MTHKPIGTIYVCPEHGIVSPPGPSGVCVVPRPKVVDSQFVCGQKVTRERLYLTNGALITNCEGGRERG